MTRRPLHMPPPAVLRETVRSVETRRAVTLAPGRRVRA